MHLLNLCDLTLYFITYIKGIRSTANPIDHRKAGVLSQLNMCVHICVRELEMTVGRVFSRVCLVISQLYTSKENFTGFIRCQCTSCEFVIPCADPILYLVNLVT